MSKRGNSDATNVLLSSNGLRTMSAQTPAQPMRALYRRSPEPVGDMAFATDALDRAPLGAAVANYIDRLKEGAVVAITADWGDGKTWFGKNLQKSLETNHLTFYLDAFEQDFTEDAFVVIAAEILRVTNSGTKSKLFRTAKKAGVAVLPTLAKVGAAAGIQVLGKLSGLDIDELTDKAREGSGNAAEKIVEQRLKEHEKSRESVKAFREALTEFCAQSEKPVVFFIDELDRCRPTFAVQVIERIKHLFDVPNLIFILLLNRRQLEAAVAGMYGEKVDAASYLNKFVHLFLALPSREGVAGARRVHDYCWEVAGRYGYVQNDPMSKFVDILTSMSVSLELTLRDVERIFVIFGLAPRINASAGLAAYMAALKLKHPAVFALFRGDELQQEIGHRQAAEIAEQIRITDPDFWLWKPLAIYHRIMGRRGGREHGNISKEEQEAYDFIRSEAPSGVRGDTQLPWLARQLDLPME
jgi:hypothetical protein